MNSLKDGNGMTKGYTEKLGNGTVIKDGDGMIKGYAHKLGDGTVIRDGDGMIKGYAHKLGDDTVIRDGDGMIKGYVQKLGDGTVIRDGNGMIIGYGDSEHFSNQNIYQEESIFSDETVGPPAPKEPNKPGLFFSYMAAAFITCTLVALIETLILGGRYSRTTTIVCVVIGLIVFIAVLIGIIILREYIYEKKLEKYKIAYEKWGGNHFR